MALKRVKKQNISDIVFHQLEECILSGEWLPGTKIPSENTLAANLGVSRVTIRTALQRLGSMGLIEAKQGGGTYVKISSEGDTLRLIKPILLQTKPDVKYFLEYRLAIEPEMAALAAERATDEQIAQIKKYLELYEEAVKNADTDAIQPNDSLLHYSIAIASANPIIIKTYEIIKDLYMQNLAQIVADVGADAGVQYHRKIVDAITQRDPSSARYFMRLHLGETVELYSRQAGE
jgi:GntR family transcriptional repressor for pyruvate dehydrogenase complex